MARRRTRRSIRRVTRRRMVSHLPPAKRKGGGAILALAGLGAAAAVAILFWPKRASAATNPYVGKPEPAPPEGFKVESIIRYKDKNIYLTKETTGGQPIGAWNAQFWCPSQGTFGGTAGTPPGDPNAYTDVGKARALTAAQALIDAGKCDPQGAAL